MSASARRSRFLTPRALGLASVAVALMAAMTVLGLWQLGVYDDRQADDAHDKLARTPVPVDDVIGPDEAFPADGASRPVRLEGHYLPDEEFVVRDSDAFDIASVVVTPLEVSTGSVMLVVRGAGGAGSPRPPGGTVALVGVLEPSDADGSALGPDRVTDGIRTAALVQDFDRDLYSGYVVLTSSRPDDPLAPIRPPTPDASFWAGLRNLVYAVQWWVFAGFVAFMWWRMVTEPAADVPPPSSKETDAGAENETTRSVG